MSLLTNSFWCQRLLVAIRSVVGKCENVGPTRILAQSLSVRSMSTNKRRKTHPPPYWVQRRAAFIEQHLTTSNRRFVEEVVEERYKVTPGQSLLKESPWPRGEWTENSVRTGMIARKIGIYPMWTKDGRRLLTTLLQVVDNHVIRYIPPEVYVKREGGKRFKGEFGCLVVGAESSDPQLFTSDYNGLFTEAGVMPKRKLTRFIVTANAAVQPGTPLSINHFRPGDYVDVYGKTIGHGFQGVVKRWGMKGGPASHGCTKAHRRVGSIGTGRQMARVWPGKKMPGHMGQERRNLVGLKIWRINTKHNVMWVQGPAVPGHVHHYVYIMDTRVKSKKPKNPPFPTFYPEDEDPSMPENILDPELHDFNEETLTFANEPEIIIEPAKVRDRRR